MQGREDRQGNPLKRPQPHFAPTLPVADDFQELIRPKVDGHSERLRRFGTVLGREHQVQQGGVGYGEPPRMRAPPRPADAAVEDIPSASYVGPDGMREMRGAPSLVGRSAAASDPVTARRLWNVSEELTGVTFPELDASARP